MSTRNRMAVALLSLLVLALSVAGVRAQDVTLRWRSRPDSQSDLDLYKAINDQVDSAWNGVTLKYEPGTGGADYTTALLSELQSGNGPDVFWLPASSLPMFIQSGLIMNLSDLAGQANFNASAFYSQQMQQLTFDPQSRRSGGVLWGLPWNVSTQVLYYNKDLFDEAGVDYPDQQLKAGNWNWDAFQKTAEAIHGLGGYVYGFGMDASWQNWSLWVNEAGGSYFNAKGACTLNTPQVATALNYLAGMYQAGVGAPYGTDSQPPWMDSKVGMYLTESTNLDPKFNWGVAEVPAGAKGQSSWILWGAYVVNAQTPHPAEAFELATRLTASDVQTSAAQNAKIPSLKSGDVVNAFLNRRSGTSNQAWINALKYGVTQAPLWTGNFDDLDTKVVEPAVAGVLNGQTSADEFTRSVCDQVQPFLNQ